MTKVLGAKISVDIFDEFERLLVDDREEGPGLGFISHERSKRIDNQVIKFTAIRIYILTTVNLRFKVNALPGFAPEFQWVARHPRDLQVSVATRFCRVLISVSSQYLF